MRSLRLAALVAFSLAVAACAGNSSPSWTYTPAPSTTPAPSASGSAAASGQAPASPAESGAGGASGSPAASGGGGGGAGSVEIDAQGIQFTTQSVTAPAGTKFTLTFKNQDNGIPHDVQIKDGSGTEVFKTDIITGVADKSYDVGPLQPGSYPFVCTIHPNMTGTLTVQ
ncbi:MAG TPA: cupredoxin domain-containing protein [Candidatus Limnocylindrales bacterium]